MWHYTTLCKNCDIMWRYVTLCDIMWYYGSWSCHIVSCCDILRDPQGIYSWLPHESCVSPAGLGGVNIWNIFWRPLLKAEMGQHGPKMVKKLSQKWSKNRHFWKQWNINSGCYLQHFVHIGPSKIPPKIDEKIGHYKNWPKIRQHTQNSPKMGPKME